MGWTVSVNRETITRSNACCFCTESVVRVATGQNLAADQTYVLERLVPAQVALAADGRAGTRAVLRKRLRTAEKQSPKIMSSLNFLTDHDVFQGFLDSVQNRTGALRQYASEKTASHAGVRNWLRGDKLLKPLRAVVRAAM